MTTKCSVFIATSLDGFIARDDGGIDWLDDANRAVPPDEDCGYSKFMADVDALVIGRNTFAQVLGFGAWPYGDMPAVVMSRRGFALPPQLPSAVSVSNEAPPTLVARLAALGAGKIYVDGGQTIQSFLAAGLIDDMTITTIPILLGSGKPLFGPLPAAVRLVHLETTAFDFGFVQTRYRVIHGA